MASLASTPTPASTPTSGTPAAPAAPATPPAAAPAAAPVTGTGGTTPPPAPTPTDEELAAQQNQIQEERRQKAKKFAVGGAIALALGLITIVQIASCRTTSKLVDAINSNTSTNTVQNKTLRDTIISGFNKLGMGMDYLITNKPSSSMIELEPSSRTSPSIIGPAVSEPVEAPDWIKAPPAWVTKAPAWMENPPAWYTPKPADAPAPMSTQLGATKIEPITEQDRIIAAKYLNYWMEAHNSGSKIYTPESALATMANDLGLKTPKETVLSPNHTARLLLTHCAKIDRPRLFNQDKRAPALMLSDEERRRAEQIADLEGNKAVLSEALGNVVRNNNKKRISVDPAAEQVR